MEQKQKFTLLKPLSEEEENGVLKHSYNRFVIGMISFAIFGLLSLFVAGINHCSSSCNSNMVTGTWVRVDDMTDGFDPEDIYIEFTSDDRFLFCGSEKGEFISGVGHYTVNTGSTYAGSGHRYTATYIKGELQLTYPDYNARPFTDEELRTFGYLAYYYMNSRLSDSDITPDMFLSPSDIFNYYSYNSNTTTTDTFVRISDETGLTAEQRAALY